MTKLLLPDNRKLRQIYAYLVLKAFENMLPVVTYDDVRDAIAVAGVSPNRYQVKKYLLILTNNNPPLIRFSRAGLYTIFYELLLYTVKDNEIRRATLRDVEPFKTDLSLILSDELTENTLTYAELLKQKMQEKSGKQGD